MCLPWSDVYTLLFLPPDKAFVGVARMRFRAFTDSELPLLMLQVPYSVLQTG
jgi:hypothetical protein